MVMVMPTKESPARALLSHFFSHFPIGLRVLYVLVKHTVPGTAPCPRLSATGQTQRGLAGAFFLVCLGQVGVVRLGTSAASRDRTVWGGQRGTFLSPSSYDTPLTPERLQSRGILFIGCHSINLELRAELHLVAGDFLRV
jgi:hypothetical protein